MSGSALPGPSGIKKRKMYGIDEVTSRLESEKWTDDELEFISDELDSEDDEETTHVQEASAKEVPCPMEVTPDIPSAESPPPPQAPTFLERPFLLPDDDKWSEDPPQDREEIPCTASPGLLEVPSEITPISFFFLFFTEQFLKLIVDETNAFAFEVFFQSESERASITDWKDTTVGELKTLLGIIFYMGIVRLNRIKDYWKTHYLFRLPITKYMARDRYLLLMRCLHFASNYPEMPSIEKILPVIDHFNKTMKKIFYPGKNLSIDESMDGCRGRLKFRQYVQGKRHKFGMKLYTLADPNGLVNKIHLYSGAEDPVVGGKDHAARVVRKMAQGKAGVGHSSFFMDNYCNSVPLANELLKKKCYCTGTLRSNRKGIPQKIVGKKFKKGEAVPRYNQDGVCVCKWKDKREVPAISSEFRSEMVDTRNRRGVSIKKPRMIPDYNKCMKGVDSSDQMLAYYPMSHKTLRWYKKLALHTFHVMLVNAHYLYLKCSTEKMDLHDFQLSIVSCLLPGQEDPPAPRPTLHIHLPQQMQKAGGRTPRKRCKNCKEKTNKRVDSMYFCPQCPEEPGLCLTPCFREFHKY